MSTPLMSITDAPARCCTCVRHTVHVYQYSPSNGACLLVLALTPLLPPSFQGCQNPLKRQARRPSPPPNGGLRGAAEAQRSRGPSRFRGARARATTIRRYPRRWQRPGPTRRSGTAQRDPAGGCRCGAGQTAQADRPRVWGSTRRTHSTVSWSVARPVPGWCSTAQPAAW